MTKLELQNKIATIEKSMAKITNPAVLAIAEKNLTQAREQLAALEGAAPSPAPSGGGSELEKLYEQREKLKKGLQSSNAVVQKASKMALPKVEAQIAELEGASPAPAPARRMPKPKAETPEVPVTKPMPTPAKRGRKPIPPAPMPTPTPAKRGRKPKAEAPMPMPTPAKRGRKPKAEAPAEEKPKIKRGRKPKAQAPAEAPAVTPARRGRPALPKGAKSQEVSLNSLTKLANAIVQFCDENGIANPTIDDVRGILNILDKNKALKFAKGGKISRSGKYLSKWQIKQILTDGGMKIGSDEILSGVWLKKKVDGIAEMRMGGEVGYFVIDDDILESGKSVMLGNRRISAKNKKFQGVFEGKMVGGLMKVYDYDDEMWKVVNPDEWQQAYAEGGGVGEFVVEIYSTNFENTLISKKNFKTEKAAIRYAYSVDDLNDDGFYFNIYGLDKNGKTLIRAFGLEEADEDLIKQNPKYKNCISWKLDMRVASYPNNKTIFSKTFSRLDKALELGISLENESLSATINNLDYTTFVYANNYAKGGGVGIPNAAWFVFQEKFPEAFEYYLKNNEYGVSKGDLMAMAYESTRNVDSAIPMELRKQVDDTMFYVYDYQNSSFGELVDLREKIKTSEVPVALSFVIDNEVFYGRNLPNELKNADFATALMYVYANRNVIDEFQIRPKRNVDNYAEGGGVGENFKVGDKIKVLGDSYTIVSFRVDNSQGYEEQRVIMKNNKGEILNYPLDMVIAYSKYAEGGGIGNILIYDGDNVVYEAKNLLMAKLWVIENWKKFDELVVMDSYGDSIVITKEDKLKDIRFLFN